MQTSTALICRRLPLTALILTLMQPHMNATIPNDLPLKFPGRNSAAFPNPWPKRDMPGKGKTPKPKSDEWKAIIDFRESKDWDDGDLIKFANYFGVRHQSLSEKINTSLEKRRRERVTRIVPFQDQGDHAAPQGAGLSLGAA